MTGTYTIKLFRSQDEFETDTLILKREGETLRGCLAEFMFTVVYFNNGKTDGNSFSFEHTPFMTIYGDQFIAVEGEIKEGSISGSLKTGIGNIRFEGIKTSELTPYM